LANAIFNKNIAIYIFFGFFIVCNINSSSAAVIFDKIVYNGDMISIGDVNYSVTALPDILFLRDNKSNIISVEVNETTITNGFVFTSKKSGSTLDEYMLKYNLSSAPRRFEDESYHELEVSETGKNVVITRTVSPSSIYPGSRFNVTITVENKELISIPSFKYAEDLPNILVKTSEWSITEDKTNNIFNPNLQSNLIRWSSALQPGVKNILKSEFELKNMPIGASSFSLSGGKITYSLDDVAVSFSENLHGNTINIISPLKTKVVFLANAEVGQSSQLSFTFENIHPTKSLTNTIINLIIPYDIIVENKPSVFTKQSENNYRYNGVFDSLEKKEFIFDVIPKSLKNNTIKMSGNYIIDSIQNSFENSSILNVKFSGLDSNLVANLVSTNVKNTVTGYFQINNLNDEISFNDVKVDIISDYSDDLHYLFNDISSKSRIKQNYSIALPLFANETNIIFRIELNYITPYGEKLGSVKSISLKIPASELKDSFKIKTDILNFSNNSLSLMVSIDSLKDIHDIENLSISIKGPCVNKKLIFDEKTVDDLRFFNNTPTVNFNITFNDTCKPNLTNSTLNIFNIDTTYGNQEHSFVQNNKLEFWVNGSTDIIKTPVIINQSDSANSSKPSIIESDFKEDKTSNFILYLVIFVVVSIIILALVISIALYMLAKDKQKQEFNNLESTEESILDTNLQDNNDKYP
jgi:hypothetical protein